MYSVLLLQCHYQLIELRAISKIQITLFCYVYNTPQKIVCLSHCVVVFW